MSVADLSDDELLLLATGPVDNLAKQRKRGPRPVSKPAVSPHADISDEELLAAIGGDEPVPHPATTSYSLADYAGRPDPGAPGPSTDENLRETRKTQDVEDAVYKDDRRNLTPQQREAENNPHDFLTESILTGAPTMLAGRALGAVGRAIAPEAGPLLSRAGRAIQGAGSGAAGAYSGGAETPREIALGAGIGAVGGMFSRGAKAAHEPRTQAETDAAVIKRGKQLYPTPDPAMGTQGTVRLAEEADSVIGGVQSRHQARNDQFKARTETDAAQRAGNVDARNAAILAENQARLPQATKNWENRLETEHVANRKSLDAPEADVIAAGPIDTTGHRGMLKAIIDETMGPAGSVLPEVERTLGGVRNQMVRPVMGPSGKPVLRSGKPVTENLIDPRIAIMEREKLNQTVKSQRVKGMDMEGKRIAHGASIVSDLTAPQGSPYREALDNYGRRLDQLAAEDVTQQAAAKSAGRRLVERKPIDPETMRDPSDISAHAREQSRIDAIDELRGPQNGRVAKLSRTGGAGRLADEAAVAAENQVSALQEAVPGPGAKLIDQIRYNQTVGRRGFRAPYIGYSATGNAMRFVQRNVDNLAFKLAPPKIDAQGMVAAQSARNLNAALPLELELMLLSQKQENQR